MNNIEKGKNFENYVASLYTALGYSVRTNVSLTGQQIDILAEKNTGEAGILRLAIECKFLESGNVKNQDIFNFSSTIDILKKTDNITKGILVTNASFTKDADTVGNKLSFIELLTIKKLETSLFDFTNIYKVFKEKYEATEIYSNYIPSKGFESSSTMITIENVEDKITEWIKEPQLRFLTIFGDFGTGKTTLLERLKYHYVMKYLKEDSIIKPIIIYLKDFQKYETLDNLLHHSILREFNREIPLESFYMAIEKGSILLLLDGFDEMVQQIDKTKRQENFLILSKLLPANAIITCRPAYFISKEEYEEYLNEIKNKEAPVNLTIEQRKSLKHNENKNLYQELNQYLYKNIVNNKSLNKIEFTVINLKEFDHSQIDNYLKKFNQRFIDKYNLDSIKIKELLSNIYDIKDLMRRPILLRMIVTTILFDKFDLTRNILNIGPASLYDSYTSHYLEIEWAKGDTRRLLTSKERAKFAMAIAVTMFINGKQEVSHAEIIKVIASNKSIGNIEKKIESNSIENIAADIKLCTFLSISSELNFKFVHKSFMEFYVAKFLRDLIIEDEMDYIFNTIFTKEILYFLSSYCLVNEDLKRGILRWHKNQTDWQFVSRSKIFERNIACALILSRPEHKKIIFSAISISFIHIKNTLFDSCTFEKVTFEEVELQKCIFLNTTFGDVTFTKTILNEISLSVKEIQINFFDSEINTCHFVSEKLSITSLKASIINTKFFAKGLTLGGNPQFQDCEFHNSKFIFNTNYSSFDIRFKKCNFYESSINMENLSSRKINFLNCFFHQANLIGLAIDHEDFDEKLFVECKGYVLINEFFISNNIKLAKMNSDNIQDNYIIIGDLLVVYEPKWIKKANEILKSVEHKKKQGIKKEF